MFQNRHDMKQNFLESEGTFYQSFQWVANYFSGMVLRIALLLTTLKLDGISTSIRQKQTVLLKHTLKKIKKSQFKKVQTTDILLLIEMQLLRA